MSTEDQALRATCQICGRSIKWKNGKIAHHGYKRPGEGWQTNSCEGAQEQPLELSRNVLRSHVGIFEEITERSRLDMEIEVISKVFTYDKGSAWNKIPVLFTVTEENFEEMKVAHKSFFSCRSLWNWQMVVERVRSEQKRRYHNNLQYLTYQKGRLDEAVGKFEV